MLLLLLLLLAEAEKEEEDLLKLLVASRSTLEESEPPDEREVPFFDLGVLWLVFLLLLLRCDLEEGASVFPKSRDW